MNNFLECFSKYFTGSSEVDRKELEQRRDAITEARKEAKSKGKNISPNSTVIWNYKDLFTLVLPEFIFSLLVGHMLGDCSIKYNHLKDTAYFSFEWGNKAYAYYVHKLLENYVLSEEPREQTRINEAGNEVVTYCFTTITLPCFAVFYHLFIKDGIKTVPIGLIEIFLTPLALAIWYQDDGGLTDYRPGHGYGITINTHGFTIETVQQIVIELNDRYGLNSYTKIIRHKGNKPVIVIPSKSYPKFYNLVKDYIHTSIAYKLPTPKI